MHADGTPDGTPDCIPDCELLVGACLQRTALCDECAEPAHFDADWGPYSRLAHRFSNAMSFGGLVYVSGQVGFASDDGAVGDITEQTNATLRAVDRALASAGSSSDRVLEVTIWLADIERDYAAMNAVYDQWASGHAPTRACIEAKLARPDLLVEIRVTAAAAACGRPKRLMRLLKAGKGAAGALLCPAKWMAKALAPILGIRLPGQRRRSQ